MQFAGSFRGISNKFSIQRLDGDYKSVIVICCFQRITNRKWDAQLHYVSTEMRRVYSKNHENKGSRSIGYYLFNRETR